MGDDIDSDSDGEWQPTAQRAASLQKQPATDALDEILRWRAAEARAADEARATAEGGGIFDFDEIEDMPRVEESQEAKAREPLAVPLGLNAEERLKFVETTVQRAIEDKAERTVRQQIQEALALELEAVPLGDKRRRELKVKAAEDMANAPDDPISQKDMKELGKILCVMEKENPLKQLGPQIGPGGKLLPPPPAIKLGEPEAIELVKRKADVNIRIGDLKRLPLHAAAERGYPRLITALIKARADPNKADFAGETALHTTAHSGSWCPASARERMLTIENLIEGQADINFANPRGRTPLHIAASAGDRDVIKVLLDEEADVNAGDLGGFTPLMWAAGHGRKYEVEALLDAEADPTLQAKRGQTAMLFALTNKYNKVADMLEDRLAIMDRQDATRKALKSEGEEGTNDKLALATQAADSETTLAITQKWPKQTLHFPYMGKVRQDFVPDMNSNVY